MTIRSFKTGVSREQPSFLPPRIEDYVGLDNVVRAIDAFVDKLDLEKLGFRLPVSAGGAGQPPYHPADLLKLFIYGYLFRIRSSRALAREAGRNLELIWLLRELRPCFRTIATFRKDNWAALKAVNREFVLMMRELNLVGGEVVAVDGAFFHGDASRGSIKTQSRLAEQLAKIERDIEDYGAALAASDAAEAAPGAAGGAAGGPSGQDVAKEVAALMAKRAAVQADLARLEASGQTQLSQTDPDARLLSKNGRVVAGYNVQIAVDDQHKLIVASEVVNDGNDTGQLHAMAKAAKEELGVTTLTALADTGYYNGNELKACEEDGIVAYVPQAKRTARLEAQGRISHEEFVYDAESDVYRCPAGQVLTPSAGRKTNTGGLPVRQDPDAHRVPLGARGGAGTASRADEGGRGADAAARRDRRTPLRHPQMPRRLSALSRSRLQQGARRMEPDGLVLQFLPGPGDHRARRPHRVFRPAGRRRVVFTPADRCDGRQGPPHDAPGAISGCHPLKAGRKPPSLEPRCITRYSCPVCTLHPGYKNLFIALAWRETPTPRD